jgi:hypothetical protein
MTTEPLPPTGPAAPADRHGPAAATVLVGALLVLVGIGWLLDATGSRCRGGRCCPPP